MSFSFFSLQTTLAERQSRVEDEMSSLAGVDKTAAELTDKLKRLQRDINRAEPWDKDQEKTKENW